MTDLVIYLPSILLAYSAFLLAIASPGPNILAVIGVFLRVCRTQAPVQPYLKRRSALDLPHCPGIRTNVKVVPVPLCWPSILALAVGKGHSPS